MLRPASKRRSLYGSRAARQVYPDIQILGTGVEAIKTIGAVALKEMSMVAPGAVFQPDEIKLMRSTLDEAATMLPQAKRTSAMKVQLASRILAAAAKGERDPVQLRIAALLEVVDI
jgi:hypothetical protein